MMELASFGCEIYSSEVDDHGVDFIARINKKFYEVQVKSMRKSNYVFVLKAKMDICDDFRLVCLLRFVESKLPHVYIVPAKAWRNPNAVLVDRNYENTTKSNPEWGIQFSEKNQHLLEPYTAERFFSTVV